MNILGYYVRLTNGMDTFDSEILGAVHHFLADVTDVLCKHCPKLRVIFSQVTADGLLAIPDDLSASEALTKRLEKHFELYSTIWDNFVKSAVQAQHPQQLPHQQQQPLQQQQQPKLDSSEPPAKRQRTDERM